MFLHCWTGNRTFYFEQVARFSQEVLVRTALTSPAGDPADSTITRSRASGELTAASMEKLRIESAVLVGHSLGGMVGLYLALEHPALVEGLVLLDTTAHLCSSSSSAWRVRWSALGRFASRPARGLVAGIAATHPLAGPRARFITARECRKVSNHVMVRTLESLRRFDVSERLGEIMQPALIIVGAADMLAGRQAREEDGQGAAQLHHEGGARRRSHGAVREARSGERRHRCVPGKGLPASVRVEETLLVLLPAVISYELFGLLRQEELLEVARPFVLTRGNFSGLTTVTEYWFTSRPSPSTIIPDSSHGSITMNVALSVIV